MENYTEKQIIEWKSKAEKWDKLDAEIGKCYPEDSHYEDGKLVDDKSEFEKENGSEPDLVTIGAMAVIAFGYL